MIEQTIKTKSKDEAISMIQGLMEAWDISIREIEY